VQLKVNTRIQNDGVERVDVFNADGLPEAQCDAAVTTSPTAVNNPEYFDEDLLETADEQAALAVHPMRLRIQSTESTASDHDEYDRLNCSSQPVSRSAQDIRLKSNGVIDVTAAHPMFAESVL